MTIIVPSPSPAQPVIVPPGAAGFDPDAWAALFPEFASIAATAGPGLFARACLQVDNTASSRITDLGIRTTILYLTTAHLAALNATVGGVSPSGLVGRINSATEGSVSVQSTLDVAPGSAQWWAQTRYGIEAWQALLPYRQARYVPGCPRPMFTGYPGSTYLR